MQTRAFLPYELQVAQQCLRETFAESRLDAEIIKVEWPNNPDPMRSSMFLANLNIGKRRVTLNVRPEKGAAVT